MHSTLSKYILTRKIVMVLCLTEWLTPVLGMQSQEITCLAWATSHRTLAAGTRKGTLVLFSMDQERRDAFTNKHGRAITGAAWSSSGLLALTGRDNQASLLPACPVMSSHMLPSHIDSISWSGTMTIHRTEYDNTQKKHKMTTPARDTHQSVLCCR